MRIGGFSIGGAAGACLLVVLAAWAGDPLPGPPALTFRSVEEVLAHVAPAAALELAPGESSVEDVVRALGNPAARSSDELAFALRGESINVRAAVHGGRLEKIQFDPLAPARPLRLADLRNLITDKQIREARARDAAGPRTHEQGRSFIVHFEEKGIGLRFIDGPDSLLVGIIRWAPED
jgi:hypothetical protein